MRRFLFLVLVPALAFGQGVQRSRPTWDMPRPAIDRGLWARPVIAPDSNTVAHVWWKSGGIRDARGNAWTQNGTVPQVGAAGRTPAGAGPFSGVNYYVSAATADVFDFAGDFSVCAVFVGKAAGSTIVSATNAAVTLGMTLLTEGTAQAYVCNGSTLTVASGGPIIVGQVNAVCWGRSGTNTLVKTNGGATVVTATGAPTTAPAENTRIGYARWGAYPLDATLYEVWASTTTPSDALFAFIQQRVKSKLGISAW